MNNRVFSFEDLEAYKMALKLVDAVYDLLKKFPSEEKFALCDQLRRAIVSVPSNLAEGSGRATGKDRVRFIEIAYCSLMEVYCQLQIAVNRQYITKEEFSSIKELIYNEARLLSGLKEYNSKLPQSPHP